MTKEEQVMIKADDAADRVAAELAKEGGQEAEILDQDQIDIDGYTAKEKAELGFEEEPAKEEPAKESENKELKKIDLGNIFDIPDMDAGAARPVLSEAQLRSQVDDYVKRYMEAQNNINSQAKTESEKVPEKKEEDVRKIAQEEFSRLQEMQYFNAQRMKTRNDYFISLDDKLNNAGVSTEDPILCEWIIGTFDNMLNQIEFQKKRPLTPVEIQKVANVHSRQISEKLSLRQPNYKPEPKAPAGGMTAAISNRAQTERKGSASTEEQLNQKYLKIAERQQGHLTPSQRTALLQERMKLSGRAKMKF